ncbi:FadR/GntR family transcriptional regulator [Isoptericola jiangsuensis]|uniref:FadR/GntR family transcriptional regulator n=1 Tax=Isoptericola jiangsuensis TaxID=548579 RepID=UPI003AB00108
MILAGELQPGMRLPVEKDLAEHLGVSRVRRVLETEAAGQTASRITPEGLAEARAVLDDAARILDAEAVDHERFIETDVAFHRVVAGHCGNPVITALVETLASRTVHARLLRGLRHGGTEARAHADHEAIWRALADHDAERARTHMAAHLLTVEEDLGEH